MGLSGMRGKVYFIDDGCPTVECGVWGDPVGLEACWTDEVTRFSVTESAAKREYGHDKSWGWQDIVYGTKRLGITIEAMFRPRDLQGGESPLRAGKVLYLKLYPGGVNGECDVPIMGFAGIDQVSYTYDQESGQPISYMMTLSSKGPWEGLAEVQLAWGGFECECGGSDGSGA